MQVFNVYFKIIKRNFLTLMIYIIVFIFFIVLFVMTGNSQPTANFSEWKSRVMIVNQDTESPLTAGLNDYLASKATLVKTAHTKDAISDALFYNDAEYVLTIPNGFSADFLSGTHSMALDEQSVPNSTAGMQMNLVVQKYLDMFRLYVEADHVSPNDTAALRQIADQVKSDLKKSTDVVWTGAVQTKAVDSIASYYSYLPYSMISIMIIAVANIMQVFTKRDLKMRIQCSPTRATKINLHLLLGNVCLALVVWFLMVLVSVYFAGDSIFDKGVLLLIANAFVLSIATLSMSFMFGYLVKSRGAQQSIANVCALGMCFVSGVFVPQYLLGDTVKQIASFTPTYWYVSAIDNIRSISTFSWANTKQVYMSMLIQLGFAAAFLVIALLIGRQRKKAGV